MGFQGFEGHSIGFEGCFRVLRFQGHSIGFESCFRVLSSNQGVSGSVHEFLRVFRGVPEM